ncbi:MAG TPA: pyridoxamine 5'-phosphate oxidase family protein [Acidimicrobiales bacterium]|nr:pyridoxamine 5'-phosphate oxidase family protein [Acidimicrobiales bacterium]
MSVAVGLTELKERSQEFGPVAFLVTVGADGCPHTVSVTVSWNGDALVVGAGRRTAENVAARPDVTLLWAAPPQGPYCLIVDGKAQAAGDEALAIEPVGAVLHRLADADQELPSCVKVLQ